MLTRRCLLSTTAAIGSPSGEIYGVVLCQLNLKIASAMQDLICAEQRCCPKNTDSEARQNRSKKTVSMLSGTVGD